MVEQQTLKEFEKLFRKTYGFTVNTSRTTIKANTQTELKNSGEY